MSLPLVFLPGMMCDARLFAPQVQAFSASRAVMVAPVTGETRIEPIAATVLAQAPSRFVLVGTDLGGMVAMDMVRQAPDRIDRLCLIATTPLPENPDEAADREPMIIAARAGRFAQVIDDSLSGEALAPGPQRIGVMGALRAMALDLGADVFERQCRALQRRKDQTATLRKARMPVKLIAGAHDPITPVKRHETMADLIPDASIEVLQDAGHVPSLETPDALTTVLRDWIEAPLVLR